jgi:hypothetical protein
LLAGCLVALPLPVRADESAEASLAVEVYRGLGVGPSKAARRARERVDVIVDLTDSMASPAPGGGSRAALARRAAAERLGKLPDDVEVVLHALGHRTGDSCTSLERLYGPAVPTPGDTPAGRLGDLVPLSEGSLAAALDQVSLELEREPLSKRMRVVLFTDLEDPCGEDLCAAAHRLVDHGAWLEIVPTSDVAPPACLADLVPSSSRPAASLAPSAADTPVFSVTSSAPSEEAGIVAVGRVGEGAVAVPAGVVTLLVHLDPPEQIGPFRLAPGESARVRVLETGEGGRPARVWRIERGDEAVGRAFPPPDELPRTPNR